MKLRIERIQLTAGVSALLVVNEDDMVLGAAAFETDTDTKTADKLLEHLLARINNTDSLPPMKSLAQTRADLHELVAG